MCWSCSNSKFLFTSESFLRNECGTLQTTSPSFTFKHLYLFKNLILYDLFFSSRITAFALNENDFREVGTNYKYFWLSDPENSFAMSLSLTFTLSPTLKFSIVLWYAISPLCFIFSIHLCRIYSLSKFSISYVSIYFCK